MPLPYIFTFYSYRGGGGQEHGRDERGLHLVGRGRHVLVVDMDLEAPVISGFLHRSKELAEPDAAHPERHSDFAWPYQPNHFWVRSFETPSKWLACAQEHQRTHSSFLLLRQIAEPVFSGHTKFRNILRLFSVTYSPPPQVTPPTPASLKSRGLMSSRRQRATNRANTQKSTGPSATGATQGPAASRYNAAKHGISAVHQIMFDETADELAELAAEYHEQYSPANPKERFLVDTLIANEWRIRRMRRVEAELWERATNTFMAENTQVAACSSGDSFATDSPTFERLQRIVNSCERAYHRALKELQVARAHSLRSPQPTTETAPTPAPASESQQSKTGSAKLASFRQNPNTPPATPSSNPGAAAGNPAAASENSPASPNPAPGAPETK
jgi:hypothetical protein